MRFNKAGTAGLASALVVSVMVSTGAAEATPADDITGLHKLVWVSAATQQTKVTQYLDNSGTVVLEAATALDDRVVPSFDLANGQIRGFDIETYEPATDEEAAQMAEALTAEVIEERRKSEWAPGELVPYEDGSTPATTQPAPDLNLTSGVVNRAAPSLGLSDGGNSGKYVYSTGCAIIDAEEIYARGCFQKQRVPTSDDAHRYSLDSTFASGHHRGSVGTLNWIKNRHNYYAGHWSTSVVDWAPGGDDPRGSCSNFTVGLTKGPVEASAQTQACPERVSMNIENQLFMNGWFGEIAPDSTWTGTGGHSVARVNKGEKMGWVYQLRACEVDWQGCEIDYGVRQS